MKRHVLEKFYGSDYMPTSYLLVMPYASGSGGNPVSGISLNDGDDVNVTLLGRVVADSFAEVYLG